MTFPLSGCLSGCLVVIGLAAGAVGCSDDEHDGDSLCADYAACECGGVASCINDYTEVCTNATSECRSCIEGLYGPGCTVTGSGEVCRRGPCPWM